MIGPRKALAALSGNQRRAAIASVVWALLLGSYAAGFFGESAGARAGRALFADALLFLVGLVVPILLFWLAALLADELDRQREIVLALAGTVAPLLEAMEETRAALRSQAPLSPQQLQRSVQGALLGNQLPDLRAALDRLLAGNADLQRDVRGLLEKSAETPARERAIPAAPSVEIEAMEIDPGAAPHDAPTETADDDPVDPEVAFGLGWPSLVRALDFPRDADDAEGFRALRNALRRPQLAQLLQAAEDVLNLLSEHDVYLDEVEIDAPDPAAWRRFGKGARGAEVASVGGVRDGAVLARARDLIIADPIFRDTALFFQRRFEAVLSEFAANASDADIAEMADTRSARAFMLLTRLSGSFG